MISYTDRSKASKQGKAKQFHFHVVKVENGKKPLIIHSYKNLKTALKECERANVRAEIFFEHEGIKPYYHYELEID